MEVRQKISRSILCISVKVLLWTVKETGSTIPNDVAVLGSSTAACHPSSRANSKLLLIDANASSYYCGPRKGILTERLFNCSWTKFIAIIVNVYVFFMQNFRLTVSTFRVTFTPLTFCFSRDLKFSLNHNFKQLNSIGGNWILKVKWKVRRNWCHFSLQILIVVYLNL